MEFIIWLGIYLFVCWIITLLYNNIFCEKEYVYSDKKGKVVLDYKWWWNTITLAAFLPFLLFFIWMVIYPFISVYNSIQWSENDKDILDKCYSNIYNPFNEDEYEYFWYEYKKSTRIWSPSKDKNFIIKYFCTSNKNQDYCVDLVWEKLDEWSAVFENQKSSAEVCIQKYCMNKHSDKYDIQNCNEVYYKRI